MYDAENLEFKFSQQRITLSNYYAITGIYADV